jgi:hypothetical protein
MADQPRGDAVEEAPQDEAATRRAEYARLLVVGGSPPGSGLSAVRPISMRLRALRRPIAPWGTSSGEAIRVLTLIVAHHSGAAVLDREVENLRLSGAATAAQNRDWNRQRRRTRRSRTG